jgi:alanine racemase
MAKTAQKKPLPRSSFHSAMPPASSPFAAPVLPAPPVAPAASPLMSALPLTSSRPTSSRPTWAEIDLGALRHNAAVLATRFGPDVRLLAVIKANAYGHGAVPVAHALQSLGPRVAMLAVASVDEGVELREAGIRAPILLLSAILPDEARAAARAALTPTVFTRELAHALDEAAAEAGRIATAHFKIDTGMGRLGVPWREAGDFYHSLSAFAHLRVEGVYTHFACADQTDEAGPSMTREQCRAFETALRDCGITPRGAGDTSSRNGTQNGTHHHGGARDEDGIRIMIHAANSAAALRYAEMRFDLARIGLTLYGARPGGVNDGAATDEPLNLQPVMTLRSRVTHLKTVPAGTTISYGAMWRATVASRIATVPIGYADGYVRCLSGRAEVLMGGVRCAVVGRVTMDQILVDCTRLPNIEVGEAVTLFGPGLPVEEVAVWAGTIPYEILCGIAHRVPRVYVND